MPDATQTQSPPDRWTTRALMRWMIDYFEQRSVDAPRITAEMLLSHVLNCDRMRLYMEVDRPATSEELARLRELVKRAGTHEPAQYLVGEAYFFTRPFYVDPSTLIPRPSTETLVQIAIESVREDSKESSKPLRIADIGTGSGAIAVCLALGLSQASVVGTDVNEDAIELARRNVERHDLADRIDLRQGDLFEPLADESPFDLICSNPPYIPDREWDEQTDYNVKEFEPAAALRGGADGLDVIRRLIAESPQYLAPGGLLFVEIADCQHQSAAELAAKAGLTDVRVEKDHEGYWRVLIARRP